MASKRASAHLLLLLAATAFSFPTANSIFARQSDDTCPSGQKACSNSLPDGFCCPSGQECIALAANTTVLCCPKGNKCDKITPITCSIDQLDPEKNAQAPIKTSVFDVDLEKCGKGTCCPFGFSCHNGNECRMNEDQDVAPGKKEKTTSLATSEPTSSQTTPAESTSSSTEAEPTDTNVPSNEKDQSSGSAEASGPDTTTIIGGVVGGIAALLALAIIIFVCARRRANKQSKTKKAHPSALSGRGSSSHNSGTSFGNIISEPIMDQQTSYRTDFMSKNMKRGSTDSMTDVGGGAPPHIRSSVHPHISVIHNPFDSPDPSSRRASSIISSFSDRSRDRGHGDGDIPNGRVVGGRLAPIRSMKPSGRSLTNSGGSTRTPSCESINVFADPDTVERRARYSMNTTVSGLLDEINANDRRPNIPGTMPRR